MSKQYILTACLFWVCGVATAQVMLPAYQGVFNKKSGTVPSAPRSPVASSGYEEATVSFTAPVSDGGNVISGYTVTSTPGGFTASGAASPITVNDLSNFTSYTFKVVATNSLGNSVASTSSNSISIFAIGTPYQGGKLAYLFKSGDPGYVVGETHGLIAAISDQGKPQWSSSNIWIGVNNEGLGAGLANTDAIINKYGVSTIYAARLAREYIGGGYSDWYLPSIQELSKLIINKVAFGGLFSSVYWSSSESASGKAWAALSTGYLSYNENKVSAFYVRAVRTF